MSFPSCFSRKFDVSSVTIENKVLSKKVEFEAEIDGFRDSMVLPNAFG